MIFKQYTTFPKNIVFVRILGLVLIFAFPFVTTAATLYLSPSSGSYAVGQQFNVKVLVRSTDKKMNAAGADISFSPQDVALVSISESNSIIDVWGEKPTFSNNTGRASFEGLILDGYQGPSGELVTLIFRAKSPGETVVRFSTGSVLAYDGLGTSILSNLQNANFTIRGAPIIPVAPAFPIPEKIPEGFQFNKNLSLSDKNIDVAYLQLCLAAEGIYGDDITGYFGPKTKRAVIDFQEKYFDDILAPWGFTRGTGFVYKTTREKLNEVCPALAEEEKLPEPLFSVNVALENRALAKSSDLVSIVTFEDFGEAPTSVELTYTILNDQRQIVFKDIETVVVETEKVIRKRFSNLNLLSGMYKLVVKAQYNVDVIDEFANDFAVGEIPKESIFTSTLFWIWLAIFLAAIIISLLLAFIGLVYLRLHHGKRMHRIHGDMKKHADIIKKRQKFTKKEKLLLHRMLKDLTDVQKSVEQDLKEIRNRLKE
ncbi:MAG: peptidoglycan-binding protein [Proteobacteria bacterium]|nr:peptidoglycan-binding protein [Pseudomonadota bacterium]